MNSRSGINAGDNIGRRNAGSTKTTTNNTTLGLTFTTIRVGSNGSGAGSPLQRSKQPIVSHTNTAMVSSSPGISNRDFVKTGFRKMDKAVKSHGEIQTAKAKP